MPHMQNRPDITPDPERWPPVSAQVDANSRMPDWPVTIWRGLCGRCPRCGGAPIFDGYLKVFPLCALCAAPLGEMPADDAPPYAAMLVVLHVLAIFIVFFYKGYIYPGLLMDGFLLLGLALVCMAALRLAKGAIIGILLKLGMRRGVLNG
jgi:uncharacterized protein (DUF983 family)